MHSLGDGNKAGWLLRQRKNAPGFDWSQKGCRQHEIHIHFPYQSWMASSGIEKNKMTGICLDPRGGGLYQEDRIAQANKVFNPSAGIPRLGKSIIPEGCSGLGGFHFQ
jgi:hypothetical protein